MCIQFINKFEENCHLYNIKSSNSWTWFIPPFIEVFKFSNIFCSVLRRGIACCRFIPKYILFSLYHLNFNFVCSWHVEIQFNFVYSPHVVFCLFILNKVVQVLFTNSFSLFSLPTLCPFHTPRVRGGLLWPPQPWSPGSRGQWRELAASSGLPLGPAGPAKPALPSAGVPGRKR